MTKPLAMATGTATHKKHVHDDVEALLPFSPSSLRNTTLQKALSKSMAHLCVLNLFSSFSTLTGEAAALSKLAHDPKNERATKLFFNLRTFLDCKAAADMAYKNRQFDDALLQYEHAVTMCPSPAYMAKLFSTVPVRKRVCIDMRRPFTIATKRLGSMRITSRPICVGQLCCA
jgi:hypothetical protein